MELFDLLEDYLIDQDDGLRKLIESFIFQESRIPTSINA